VRRRARRFADIVGEALDKIAPACFCSRARLSICSAVSEAIPGGMSSFRDLVLRNICRGVPRIARAVFDLGTRLCDLLVEVLLLKFCLGPSP
jgi:hypothetical protein